MENALFEFMYSTGCRIGEVVKLNRDDINFLRIPLLYMEKVIKKGKCTLILVVPFG